MLNKIKSIFRRLGHWLRQNITRKSFLICLIIAEVVFWSPCAVCAALAILISPWYWTAFSAIIVFWSGPFTPAVPLQVALALGIEQIYVKIKKRRSQHKEGGTLTEDNNHGTKHKRTYDRPDYYD